MRYFIIMLCSIAMSACGPYVPPTQTTQSTPATTEKQIATQDAIPKQEPLSHYGNPTSYTVFGKTYHVMRSAKDYSQTGIASWYGPDFQNKRTSSGETYNMYQMTAAHKTLPIPSYVRVTNLDNGEEVIVRVNDRGPFHSNRVIDLSYAAAQKIGIIANGTGLVQVDVIDPRENARPAPTHDFSHHSKIYLKLGSFEQKSNAENLASKVGALVKYPIHLTDHPDESKPYYQVLIGPIDSVETSDSIQKELKYAGLGEAITVIR